MTANEGEKKTIGISFGALAPKLSEQLTNQGFKFSNEKVKHFEILIESMNYIRFGDIMNDATFDKTIQRLYKKIVKHVADKNKLTVNKHS